MWARPAAGDPRCDGAQCSTARAADTTRAQGRIHRGEPASQKAAGSLTARRPTPILPRLQGNLPLVLDRLSPARRLCVAWH